ncbi:MAG: Ig-like domain-containing protein [Acidobacteriota bacterium]
MNDAIFAAYEARQRFDKKSPGDRLNIRPWRDWVPADGAAKWIADGVISCRFMALVILLWTSFAPATAFAQSAVSVTEDFQSIAAGTHPAGWTDVALALLQPAPPSAFVVWRDPLDPQNQAYGVRQSSGSPAGESPAIGTISARPDLSLPARGHMELRGRLFRGAGETRVGVALLASLPEKPAPYLIGLWPGKNGNALRMQLFAGDAPLSGVTDAATTIPTSRWYRFAVSIDSFDDGNLVRARFWPDGTIEPQTWSINALDARAVRPSGGTFGLWAARVSRTRAVQPGDDQRLPDALFDDIALTATNGTGQTPADIFPPTIELFESGSPLTQDAVFDRDVRIEIRVSDQSAFTSTARLDGNDYTSLAPITAEGVHTLVVQATDSSGNSSSVEWRFIISKTGGPVDTIPPVIAFFESGLPIAEGAAFGRDVQIEIRVTDASTFTSSATLDGVPYASLAVVSADGPHTIEVEAIDAAGNRATARLNFSISHASGSGDPTVSIASPGSGGQIVPVLLVTVTGRAANAQSVTVNGVNAAFDVVAGAFSAAVPLNEGANVVTATARSTSGRVATASIDLVVDSQPPLLVLSSPGAAACVSTGSLSVTGTASDPHIDRVEVRNGTVSAPVVLDKGTGQFTATLADMPEGRASLTVEALDSASHRTSIVRTVIIDRTAPAIEVTRGGLPFDAALANEPVSLSVRASDLDPSASLVATLDGTPFVPGTAISAEGSHRLTLVAVDCAGNRAERTVDFEIDTTPPVVRNLTPTDGSSVATMPSSIGGTTDADAVEVALIGTPVGAVPANGSFTLSGVPFIEGLNRFSLVATDRAGNSSRTEYRVTVDTKAPGVEIVENGLPIAPGTLFNHPIAPTVRTDGPATISAQLNGAAFTPGTSIVAEGSYSVTADATDAQGHSGHAQTSFVIDQSAPVVKITSPVAGAVQGSTVEVRGTATESSSATVNGIRSAVTSGSFLLASLPLDYGETVITATAADAAGNIGSDQVVVTRETATTGIILTWPPEGLITNRTSTRVSGRLLKPGSSSVRINATDVAVDSAGDFILAALPLAEGENTITVTVSAGSAAGAQISVHVRGDFTPPSLEILESGQPLSEGATFPSQAVISVNATDASTVTSRLNIDGAPVTSPATVNVPGGHTAIATGRDAAGNETRMERNFSIGANSTVGGCDLRDFDPADHSVVTASSVLLTGQSGGAAGVKVNGASTTMAGSSFLATLELPSEGANVFTISCADAAGAATGNPVTLTFFRVTGNPSITITTPEEGLATADTSITVSGTIDASATSADVNGVSAVINAGTFTAANVPLSDGANILVARGRNAGNGLGQASRRVTRIAGQPILTITAPAENFSTGSTSLRVSGTWSRLDPSTVVLTNVTTGASTPGTTTRRNDSSGTFRGDVPLAAGVNSISVTARDQLGRQASALISVTGVSGDPSISIAQPLDNSVFGIAEGASLAVSGAFSATPGSTVEVNGASAAVSGSGFTATVPFSTSGLTQIVARVRQPDGRSAVDLIRVTNLTSAPRVLQTFPADGALSVENGAIILVSFSAAMQGTSTSGAFTLRSSSGTPVTGSFNVDNDVLSFSPAALLTAGERYTIALSTGAQDLGGNILATPFAASFTVASTAPLQPPVLDPIIGVCTGNVTVAGSAPSGSRIRLQSGLLVLNADADSSGRFSFSLPASGQAGVRVVRVRVAGADGSLSPAAESSFQTVCGGVRVLSAAFDRTANRITVAFSGAVDPASISVGPSGSVHLQLASGTSASGSVSVLNPASVTIAPAQDLSAITFTLAVTPAVKDVAGNNLTAAFSQTFTVQGEEPPPGDGSGFISGEVFDATTGRPLAGATVTVEVPVNAFSVGSVTGSQTSKSSVPRAVSGPGEGRTLAAQSTITAQTFTATTDARGRYTVRVPEGAHTIQITAPDHTGAWRQIIVAAGQGVVPIDVRLETRGESGDTSGDDLDLSDGGTDVVRGRVTLYVPAGSLDPGTSIRLTSLGAQALPGLLPLGWSPLAAAEVSSSREPERSSLASAALTFAVPGAAIVSAAQTLAAVQYDSERDEWIVLDPAASVSGDSVTVNILTTGSYALVYRDLPPRVSPPAPVRNAPLQGISDSCASLEEGCSLTARSFTLDPAIVAPTGRTVASISVDGPQPPAPQFPSGTAVQAWVDEELRLADGSTVLDPPFATDLLIYRTLDGAAGEARFHLAPSPRAAQVILEIGFDHVRVVPYPGRLDRGTLVGPEGGRVPGDSGVAVEIPEGAVNEALHAQASSLAAEELQSFGAIAGFRILAGFQLSLNSADPSAQNAVAPLELLKPARATFARDAATGAEQLILAEVLGSTPYGRVIRMVAQVAPIDPPPSPSGARLSTVPIDRAILPLDGVIHEGRYLLLVADNPLAFATGAVRLRSDGIYLGDALVSGGTPQGSSALGVSDVTRASGLFVVPVLAAPAAPFALTPRHSTTGTGAAYLANAAPALGSVVRIGDLPITPQPPVITSTTPANGAKNVSLTTPIRINVSPGLDVASVVTGACTSLCAVSLTDATGAIVPGILTADPAGLGWTRPPGERLKPNGRYMVTVSAAIRGTNGTPLGQTLIFTFETISQLTDSTVDPRRIHITIPVDGVSRIYGTSGSITSGWQAVAVRRGVDFVTRYQATVSSDGSFSFEAGCARCPDSISLADSIDLQVINSAGNVAAVLPLTPFVTSDGQGFVVSPDHAADFTSKDGITIHVPAGAFDDVATIHVAPTGKDPFAAIPNLDNDLDFITAVSVEIRCGSQASIECVARKRLEIALPTPSGLLTANRNFLLGSLGQSVRGPRIMIVDTLRLDGGNFTTESATTSATMNDEPQASPLASRLSSLTSHASPLSSHLSPLASQPPPLASRLSPLETLTGTEVKNALLGLERSGIFAVVDLHVPPGASPAWILLDGVNPEYDLFWDTYEALYASHSYFLERGRVALPVVSGKPFTLVGFDANTGQQAFSKAYDPIAVTDPGSGVTVESPIVNSAGPYPVFGTPFRIESVLLNGEGATDTSIPGMNVTLQGGIARIKVPVTSELPADATINVLDPTRGTIDRTRDLATNEYAVAAAVGDQVIVTAPTIDVDPGTLLSLVFSEPINSGPDSSEAGVDSFLQSLFTLEEDASPPDPLPPRYVPAYGPVVGVHYRLDSNGRRLLIDLPSSLTRGALYRLRLSQDIQDRDGMRIGQARAGGGTTAPLTEPFDLRFQVRQPGGDLGSFDISSGQIRDLSLNGNLLFVTALSGGLSAWDVSHAATPVLAASIPAGVTDNWAVASDGHNRLYTTGLTPEFGIVRSYRLESLFGEGGSASIEPGASAIVSWAPGVSSGLGLSSATVLSDRPEAIPRKLQLLVQDDIGEEVDLATFRTLVSIVSDEPLDGGFARLRVTVPFDPANPYRLQRITVENITRDMRWSGDAVGDSTSFTPAIIANIAARAGDRLRIIRNRTTYGVISQFGFGIGVYDLNAIDSNDEPSRPAGYKPVAEQVHISSAAQSQACPPFNAATADGAITDLTFTPEAAIEPDGSSTKLKVYGVDARKGILDIRIDPSQGRPPDALSSDVGCIERAPFGLVFANSLRLQELSAIFKAKTGRDPSVRFTGISSYHWRLEAKDNRALAPASGFGSAPGARGSRAGEIVQRNYLLVPGNEFGLLVVETGGTPPASSDWLDENSLADVIWIPNGAASVRAIPRSNLAVVVDGLGYVLLVDLGRIDERWTATGEPYDPASLFPTATKALSSGTSGPGILDPRVVWRSATPLASGTLAPVIDPDTGIVFAPELLGTKIEVIAAIDPRLRMMVDLGDVDGLTEVSGIVPLGIAPPLGVSLSGPDASLGAFRFEITLPGSVVDALISSGNELEIAVESERVFGAVTEQTEAPMPRAHLRRAGGDGSPEARPSTTFIFQRAVPNDPALRRQRGYNKFVSPWIVAIADPRASEQYQWPKGTTAQQKADLGCYSCNRPASLAGKSESDGVFELYTNGRIIAARPECAPPASSSSSSSSSSEPRASSLEPRPSSSPLASRPSPLASSPCSTIFSATPYDYLGTSDRLVSRFATVMADTVRPTDVLVAGQNPAVATGMIEGTVYLHSGELETSSIDLDAGGRGGWDVLVDRAYRSRTLGAGFIGSGWESSLFRRLRALPDGDVEYRDGAGEVWRFATKAGGYQSPVGLFLTLARSDHGWALVDQKWRTTTFDQLGRITAESDEFTVAGDPFSTGNVIRYLYNRQGLLSQILDPAGRMSTLDYWTASDFGVTGSLPGAVKQITDWRGRTVSYQYAGGHLATALLPDVENTDGNRPATRYAYSGTRANFNDFLELDGNLATITDPSGPGPRLQLSYDSSPALRDHLKSESWGTGETASIDYASPTHVVTIDALGQSRETDLTPPARDYTSDRSHALSLTETSIPVSAAPYGALPTTISAIGPLMATADRSYTFVYDAQGLRTTSTLNGVRSTATSFVAPAGAPGLIPSSMTTTPIGGAAKASVAGAADGSEAITRMFLYRTEANLTTFLQAVQANGLEIQSPEIGRSGSAIPLLVRTNNSVTASATFDPDGQLTRVETTGGTDPDGAGSLSTTTYYPLTAALWERGLPQLINDGGLISSFQYPDRDTVVITDPRGVITRTELDSWRRSRHVTVKGPAELESDERYEYDASGRLRRTTRTQGTLLVTTDFTWDVMNRPLTTTTSNVDVSGALAPVETSTAYDLPARKIVTTLPAGATVTAELDPLGRIAHRRVHTGSSPIEELYAYDLNDHLVYASDMQVASAAAFDAHGREVATMEPDGTKTVRTFDAWSRPTVVEHLNSSGLTAARMEMDYTPAGRMTAVRRAIDPALLSESRLTWDGAGRTTGFSRGANFTSTKGASVRRSAVETLPRATHVRFDPAGRLLAEATGAGTAAAVSDPFEQLAVDGFTGMLPTAARRSERGGSTYALSAEYNTLGDAVGTRIGPLQFEQHFDQAGNVTAAKEPARPASSYEYDARGSLRSEAMPDGAENHFQYDASGALKQYLDPVSEATSTETDLLGRPLARTYADGTRETIEWDGPRVAAVTDRQKRKQAYVYNNRGQVVRIEGGGGTITDVLDYDEAGRLTRWTNKDAAIEYGEFDLASHPRRTTQTRYRDASGLGAKTILDSYSQQHTWNEHDERTSTTMPSYPGFAPAGAWTSSLEFSYDAMGNESKIVRTPFGGSSSTLLEATWRNAGRPDQRTMTTFPSCGAGSCTGGSIRRTYGYSAADGRVISLEVATNGVVVAGSAIEYDGLQIARATLLGVSGGKRASVYDYDARSRLRSSQAAREVSSEARTEVLSAADFREEATRPRRFDEAQRAALAAAGVNVEAIDPSSIDPVEQSGHKIDKIVEGTATREFNWNGAERSDDGQFVTAFDEKGRLTSIEQKLTEPRPPALLRALYSYDGNNRMVGRRIERAAVSSGVVGGWTLAPPELTGDGLPAEATFVWDPVSDRMVSVFKAGASTNPAIDANGGLLRQFIHGDMGYDDPIEVTTADPTELSPQLTRLYPIYDEAAAGGLQAILNDRGEVISRHIAADPYGDEETDFAGPAVDGVEIKGKKVAGSVSEITVSVRLTEEMAAETVSEGLRLAVVDGDGAVVRSWAAAPTLIDNSTAGWALSGTTWDALIAGGAALTISATRDLRAVAWGEVPIVRAPEWARVTRGVKSSAQVPFEVEETLASLSSWLASLGSDEESTRALYEVPELALAASDDSTTAARVLVLSPFQALPYQDPISGHIYARERWLDPGTGTWLTPDPMGYGDSSNLYAFASGDPVNDSDPTGESAVDSLKGFGKGIFSSAVGAGRGLIFVGRVAVGDPTALRQVPAAIRGIKQGAANWGAAWGEVLGDPEAFGNGLNELTDEEIGGAIGDATFMTVLTVAPLARPAQAARLANVTAQGSRSVELEEIAPKRTLAPRQQFDAKALSDVQVDIAILKSIRRKSGATGDSSRQITASSGQVEFMLQKTAAWRRNAKAADPDVLAFDSARKGTILHSSVQKRIRQLNVRDLIVNQRLYGTSQFISPNTGLPYGYRIPDFRLRNTIFDIKPAGTPLSGPQYFDFMSFANTADVRWIYYGSF